MTSNMSRVVIIGAGQAGVSAATFLRSGGFRGQILLFGDEQVLPYQRPPLSKAFLKGEIGLEDLWLKSATFYVEQNIDLRLGIRVEEIDRKKAAIRLANGTWQAYDNLIIATGSRPRALPDVQEEMEGLHQLRSYEDTRRLRKALSPDAHIVLVGGGYIGLEVAASARALGARATVIELEDRLLARVASRPVSNFLEGYHRARGVEIITCASVAALETDGGRLTNVRLADGRRFQCTAAVVAIGGVPNDQLGRMAGLSCDGGILVDHNGRTSDPAIFAIGDVSRRPLPFYGDRVHRLESVGNAVEQARLAVAAILGQERPEDEVHWFWSDQFDVKFKSAGAAFDADRQLLRGSSEGRFSVLHLKDDRLISIETINTAGDFVAGRKLIASRQVIDDTLAADADVPLKSLISLGNDRKLYV